MPQHRVRLMTLMVVGLMAAWTVIGCSGSSRADGDKPVVLTTFTVLADIAANVAGDRLQVESITKPGAEIHGYEPTPADVRTASTASLIVDNGLNLEAWFGQFVEDLDVPHVVVSAGVDPIPIASDAYAGKPNPHAWMSPVNVGIYVDNLVAAFTDLDPDGAETYRANAAAYKQQLDGVQDDLVAALQELPANERALVTCEGAFSYLARDAGLTEHYLWPVNAESQATPQQVAGVIDVVREQRIPAVFCESTVSDKPMQQVVSATGARFGGTLYVDSLSQADGPVPTYLDLIRHDVTTIVTGLTGTAPAS
ncbi:metal ABC transporter substrate-binding protein [Gordonia sp. VNQ95]|uniref:metal ABC transporter substrate-binding protein n=1 Tax=Gordonia sp. VNQ95 TaxID=3156619 RepID=UPI0032B36586